MKKVLTIFTLTLVLLLAPFIYTKAYAYAINPNQALPTYPVTTNSVIKLYDQNDIGSQFDYYGFTGNGTFTVTSLTETQYLVRYTATDNQTYVTNNYYSPERTSLYSTYGFNWSYNWATRYPSTLNAGSYVEFTMHKTGGVIVHAQQSIPNLFTYVPPEPTNEQIGNYDFTGLKILSPDIGTTINKSVYELTVNANIPHEIQWAMNGKEIAEQIAMITSEIKSTLTIEDNSTRITPIGDVIIDWVGQTTTNYKLQIKVMLPNKINGTNNLNVGANFKTKFNYFTAPTIKWYNDTSTFDSILPIDTNNDGIDDNTGNNIIIDNSKKPNRDNYVSGMEGDIQFYWDTFVYYITFPFRLIRDSITMFFNEIEDLMSVLSAGSDKLTTLFQWVPTPIMRLAWLGVISSIIFTILRR